MVMFKNALDVTHLLTHRKIFTHHQAKSNTIRRATPLPSSSSPSLSLPHYFSLTHTMAYNYCHSLIAAFFISNVLLAMTGQAFGGRDIPTDSKSVDKKQPEWLFEKGGSFFIPGIGRILVPPVDGSGGIGNPFGGSSGTAVPGGNNPVGGSSGTDIPGGDDTIIPNPGVEVPNPAAGGSISSPSSP